MKFFFYIRVVCPLFYPKIIKFNLFFVDVRPKCCFVQLSDGVLVGHMPFQEKKNYLQPCSGFKNKILAFFV